MVNSRTELQIADFRLQIEKPISFDSAQGKPSLLKRLGMTECGFEKSEI